MMNHSSIAGVVSFSDPRKSKLDRENKEYIRMGIRNVARAAKKVLRRKNALT